MLNEKVLHDATELRLVHWAKVEIEEHILVENIGMLLKNLYFLHLRIVDYYHWEASGIEMYLCDGEFFQNFLLSFNLEKRFNIV